MHCRATPKQRLGCSLYAVLTVRTDLRNLREGGGSRVELVVASGGGQLLYLLYLTMLPLHGSTTAPMPFRSVSPFLLIGQLDLFRTLAAKPHL